MVELKDKIVFVTGATGHQGSAAVRHLLEAGFQVRGLTREPDKPEAKRLEDLGAELVRGDLDDPERIRKDMSGAYGVFAVLTWKEEGAQGEVRQGRNIADAAKAEGVKHFLYSSVGGADRSTGIPHFESKATNERYMRSIGLPLTILRPTHFMENFNAPSVHRLMADGKLIMALDPRKRLQMISVEDIGFIAAIMLDNPDDWMGKAVEIAGDSLTMPEVAEKLSTATGRKVVFQERPLQELKKIDNERFLMMKWLNEHGYEADIPSLRKIHPSLMTLDQWLDRGYMKKEEELTAALRSS
ncbi:MAG: NmrA/HSCARG family protein [Methanomassiliicoccus sp.]|nr:NmrA/HSCARG family protein [Methanomassiliicoccus sp.]